MASDGTGDTISPEKTLNCGMENFRPITEEHFEGDALGEQDREPDNSFSFSGQTHSEKDNNQSAGMSFQILSNFITWFNFHNLWNRRIEHLTLSLVGKYKENYFFRLSITEEVIILYRSVCLSKVMQYGKICASDESIKKTGWYIRLRPICHQRFKVPYSLFCLISGI